MSERIVYGAIASPAGVQVYHSDFLEINPIIQALIGSIEFSVDQKRSFGAHERTKNHTIQYMVENNVAYISAASAQFPHRICFRFLESLATEYKSTDFNSPKAITQFEHYIRDQMNFFSDDSNDPLARAKLNTNSAASVASSNIKVATEREEGIKNMSNKAEKLESKAIYFEKKARSLRCELFKRNIKLTIFLIVFILAIIFVVGFVVIFFIYTSSSSL